MFNNLNIKFWIEMQQVTHCIGNQTVHLYQSFLRERIERRGPLVATIFGFPWGMVLIEACAKIANNITQKEVACGMGGIFQSNHSQKEKKKKKKNRKLKGKESMNERMSLNVYK